MFNRHMFIFSCILAITFGLLWWYWQSPLGESLETEQSLIGINRYSQNLNGDWEKYSSLRQAWTKESEFPKENYIQSLLKDRRAVTLPSSERFSVIAKRFRIPAEWSSRTMLLTFNGVQGHAAVYLNGITSSNKIGEFEGSGGTDELEIPAKAFRYGEDNILLVELAGSTVQRTMFLGSDWPKSGKITGNIRLDAVVETTLMSPQIDVTWADTTAHITVTTSLRHHGFTQDGPWTVYGVLSDESAGIAEQTLIVNPQEGPINQPVTLEFTVPDARRWTMQAPFCYQLYLTVTNSNGDTDDLTLPLGLRSLMLASGKWVLNDQEILLKGTALTVREESLLRHAGQAEDWLKSKQAEGINLVYFIGQIPDELWLHAADRVGMGVWAELPVELIPSGRLPSPDVFQKVVAEKMCHPSLWAWTVGKGLDSEIAAQTYFRKAVNLVQPNLAFAINTAPVVDKGLLTERSLYVQGNKLEGEWGEVALESPSASNAQWVQESIVARTMALLMIFLVWMNIRSVTWRYKEIFERKPKRRLRSAWFWSRLFAFARQAMLAGLVTSGIFRIPIHSHPWFVHLWPGIELLQFQSPWLIWAALSVFLMFLRLLYAGVAAPHLPGAPHPLVLVYWLERRYRFAFFIAIGWALIFFWEFPFYTLILAYIFLVFLFLPLRIRDIRKVGGRYRVFLWVPGIIACVLIIWVLWRYEDWIYLWHMSNQYLSSIAHVPLEYAN